MGKFSTARWVCGPYMALAGTFISPRLSFSIRNSGMCSSGWGDLGARGDGLQVLEPAQLDAMGIGIAEVDGIGAPRLERHRTFHLVTERLQSRLLGGDRRARHRDREMRRSAGVGRTKRQRPAGEPQPRQLA